MTVYPTPVATLEQLQEQDRTIQLSLRSLSELCHLVLESNKGRKYGTFKGAARAKIQPSIFDGSTIVCAKYAYYLKKSPTTGKMVKIAYNPMTQLSRLEMEVRCIQWGQALLDLVFIFMNGEIARRGLQKHVGELQIPSLRFVRTALAISHGRAEQAVYMLEEFIDTENVKFVKYINNDSPVPRIFANPEDDHRAEFLAFAQHVQYWKTKGLIFVSDFQGMCYCSLCDVQLCV